MTGKVTFVGAGCGDARLLTLRALEVLAGADFVVFDPKVHPDILARLREGTPRATVTPAMAPEDVASWLAREARGGRHIVRLAWGDPFLFGTVDAEGSALARYGVPFEVVPGIAPLLALGAFAGIPLTRTGDASPSVAAVSVVRGHEDLHEWDKLATATDTLFIECDAESVSEVARLLRYFGRQPDTAVSLVEFISLPSQRLTQTTLAEAVRLVLPPSRRVVLVVGSRAKAEPALSWFSNLPLFGKRVLVTRAREQAGDAASRLRERGADPVVVPTIEIHPPSDPGAMIDAVQAMPGRYDWVVLTSANGVDKLCAEITRQGKDARAFGGMKVAAIGPGTARALERCGIVADIVAKEHRQEGLASDMLVALLTEPPAGKGRVRVLLARAEVARDMLPDALRAAGCTVDVVAVYKTRAPHRSFLTALSSLLESAELDVVTFTSSSTVEHLCDALEGRAPELLAKTCVASIGPVTTETAKKRGLRVDVVASECSVAGLVAALEEHFGSRHAT